MKLDGTIRANLEAALRSARRLRGHPVYSDTILYWQQIVSEARRAGLTEAAAAAGELEILVVELEKELSDRTR